MRTVFSLPGPLREGVERMGDPIAVLPVAFRLLWAGESCCELDMPMSMEMPVHAGVRQ
ncbi:hypothetical protein [Amycolatopsis sp. NPDC098790]|uniref:hypothetical protein n=1 Tax=Amycolatopsis sp. NPDC098790 TaxID=3363939 RepID=UPI0037F94877